MLTSNNLIQQLNDLEIFPFNSPVIVKPMKLGCFKTKLFVWSPLIPIDTIDGFYLFSYFAETAGSFILRFLH